MKVKEKEVKNDLIKFQEDFTFTILNQSIVKWFVKCITWEKHGKKKNQVHEWITVCII